MAMLSNESADQSYLDNYFLYRRPKEIQRMIIGVLGLLMGASVMLFAEQITVFLNVSENLNVVGSSSRRWQTDQVSLGKEKKSRSLFRMVRFSDGGKPSIQPVLSCSVAAIAMELMPKAIIAGMIQSRLLEMLKCWYMIPVSPVGDQR